MNQTQTQHLFQEFEHLFWAEYPLKVGKLAAQKAWLKARQKATALEIAEGVRAYKLSKPASIDWCNPTTFLNQGRWLDERPATVRRVAGSLQRWW